MMSHNNIFKQRCLCEPAIWEDLDLHVAIFWAIHNETNVYSNSPLICVHLRKLLITTFGKYAEDTASGKQSHVPFSMYFNTLT